MLLESEMDTTDAHRSPAPTIIRILAVAIVLGAFLTALVLQTGEEDLVPCSLFTEFTPCGHRTDYRIPLRIGTVAVGVLTAVLMFRIARLVDESHAVDTLRR
jgi:hypothetical protein